MDAAGHGRPLPVCMRCGNRDIRPQTTQEGLWPGGGEALGWWTCERCSYLGPPLLVDPSEAPAPDSAERWDETTDVPEAETVAPPEAPAVVPPRPQPVLGALLLLASLVFLAPLAAVLFWMFAGASVGEALGGVGVAGLSLLFGLVLGRAGWRMLRPRAS